MFKQSIKTNILTIFILLVSLISLSFFTSQYYFSKKIALKSIQKTSSIITNNILNVLNNNAQMLYGRLEANSNNKDFLQDITPNYKHPALDGIIQILQDNKTLYSAYFNDKNGSLYLVINMHNSPTSNGTYKAPRNTQWLNIIYYKSKAYYTFLDKHKNVIKSFILSQTYNLHSRPWYKKALHSNTSILTEPYRFAHSTESGLTFATLLHNRSSVLAFDYTISRLDSILAQQKYEEDSEIYIFDKRGKKLVSSNANSSKNVPKSLLATLNNGAFTTYTNSNYTTISPLLNKNMFLGIEINTTSLLTPFIENLKYSSLISLIIFIFTIPIIFLSTSIITKPIHNLIQENEKIKHRQFEKVAPIDTYIYEFQDLSSSLVSMSKNIQKYQKAQEEIFDAIVKLIAEAIDAKSPYTGAHCKRVPIIAQMLVEKANQSKEGIFKEFNLKSADELREFNIGSLLHDCGKLTTPEYVVDKSTKLETLYNRIHEIRTRFEVLWRDAEIKYLKAKLRGEDEIAIMKSLKQSHKKLLDDFDFIAAVNNGVEVMSTEKQKRINKIGKIEWFRHFDDTLGLSELEADRYQESTSKNLPTIEKLLCDKKEHIVKRENFDYESYKKNGFKEEVPKYLYNYGEIYNLSIESGTLSTEERYKINEHVIFTIKMLEKIPFPTHMNKIPEYAGTHHETLIGTGYPRKLTKDELSIPARIMAIADIFEALTASDRPYKKAKTLSQTIEIMSFMVHDKHIDKEIFELFLKNDLHNLYAKKYLNSKQIDVVDIKKYI